MSDEERYEKLWTHLERVAVCTVVSKSGNDLIARPMRAKVDRDSKSLIFVVRTTDAFVKEVIETGQAMVVFSDHGSAVFATVYTTVSVDADPQRARSLWDGNLSLWLPEGPDHDDIGCLICSLESANYWAAEDGVMKTLWEITKARMLGQVPRLSGSTQIDNEHKKED